MKEVALKHGTWNQLLHYARAGTRQRLRVAEEALRRVRAQDVNEDQSDRLAYWREVAAECRKKLKVTPGGERNA